MFFRRSPAADIEPVHRALAEGRYEAALALLEGAAKRQRGSQRREQAQFKLDLAAAYALYGEDGLEGGLLYLSEAAEADNAVTHTPLYRALYWEFAAYQGEAISDVKRGALSAAEAGDATAMYHAACALAAIHAFKRAVQMLLEVDTSALPAYLEWRYWSLLGRSYEAQGGFEKAAGAFEHSAALCPDKDKFSELLNLAANRLEAQQPVEALAALEAASNASDFDNDNASERAVQRYLTGRAHLLLGNPNTALNLFLEASVFERTAGEGSFSLQLALGQTYSLLGKLRRAAERYSAAVQLASKRQRALALHEYALVTLEADDLERAKALLLQASRDEHYSYHAEVYADLADVELRLGNLRSADDLAQRALDLGATTPACLTLGNIAHDYYRFDEAIVWFEKAASASVEGSAEWLFAKEMLVDSFVQQGYAQPSRVVHHAEAALRYLSPFDEWTFLLKDYLAHAKTLLGGHPRMLN